MVAVGDGRGITILVSETLLGWTDAIAIAFGRSEPALEEEKQLQKYSVGAFQPTPEQFRYEVKPWIPTQSTHTAPTLVASAATGQPVMTTI